MSRRRSMTQGLNAPPGTLIVPEGAPPPVIRVMAYGPDRVEEQKVNDPVEARGWVGKYPVIWINVDGLGSAPMLESFGREFGVHRLALEDIATLDQRAKIEPYEQGTYVVARMTYLNEGIESEQLSLYLGEGFVLTFQERPGDCLEPLRARIRNNKGRVRYAGPDYLAYAVLDAVIDAYFPILESMGDRLETLERTIVAKPSEQHMLEVRKAKAELLQFRRAVWPLREALHVLDRDRAPMFTKETRVYLRDGYDHCLQVIDMIETYRESVTGLTELYMSSMSNRMNEIMKVLTIFAAIFIPLTFVAGIYGMNFNPEVSPWNMPELSARYGYPAALAVMLAIAVVMLIYFYRKGWIGRT